MRSLKTFSVFESRKGKIVKEHYGLHNWTEQGCNFRGPPETIIISIKNYDLYYYLNREEEYLFPFFFFWLRRGKKVHERFPSA